MRIVLWSNTYFYNSQVGKVTPESTFCHHIPDIFAQVYEGYLY